MSTFYLLDINRLISGLRLSAPARRDRAFGHGITQKEDLPRDLRPSSAYDPCHATAVQCLKQVLERS